MNLTWSSSLYCPFTNWESAGSNRDKRMGRKWSLVSTLSKRKLRTLIFSLSGRESWREQISNQINSCVCLAATREGFEGDVYPWHIGISLAYWATSGKILLGAALSCIGWVYIYICQCFPCLGMFVLKMFDCYEVIIGKFYYDLFYW